MIMSDADFQRVRVCDARIDQGIFLPYAGPESRVAPAAGMADDPVADDYQRGYTDGVSAAETVYLEERTRLLALIRAVDALKPEPSEELAKMIAEAVAGLVAQIVGNAPIDNEILAERARACAALVGESDAARTIRTHPDNVMALADAGLDLEIVGDPQMPIDALRIDCSAGWIESGTSQHLEALRAQLGLKGTSA
jgi:flagellar assembly protein FliH